MYDDVLASVLLGLIEGFTEFLPISSTAHLLIAGRLLGPRDELFTIAAQGGAILAVAVVFRTEIARLVVGALRPSRPEGFTGDDEQSPRAYLARVAAAFTVTAVLGLAMKANGWELPTAVRPIAWALVLGAVWMLAAERAARKRWARRKDRGHITWSGSVAVGLAQVVAGAFPGTSRSAAAMLVVLLLSTGDRPRAAQFVFLVGLPTLLGASAFSVAWALQHASVAPQAWLHLFAGMAAAFVAAWVSVRGMIAFLRRRGFSVFALYRIVLGLLLLTWGDRL